MTQMTLRSKYIYPVASLFVLCWWLLAFHRPVAYEVRTPLPLEGQPARATPSINSLEIDNLHHVDRDRLKKGLDGDVVTIGQLIIEWDLAAEIIEHGTEISMNRLSREDFLKAQLLVKTLTSMDHGSLNTLRNQHRLSLLVDDKGCPFDLSRPPEFFLPQTYLSAGILIALLEPESIVALPRGMRQQTDIYPKISTDIITQDIDSFHMEQLYSYRPDIALISERYTHPLTLQALDSQKIPKYHLPEVKTIEDIESLVCSIGHLCNRPLKAELMSLFMKAGVLAIDNERVVAMYNSKEEKILVLNYYSKFSLPGKNTLTHHMVNRIGIPHSSMMVRASEDSWSIPISEEMIIQHNPDKLIIITSSDPKYVKDYFYQTSLFQFVKAAQNDNVEILNETIQQTISQYVLLAYYDLNRALVNLYAK